MNGAAWGSVSPRETEVLELVTAHLPNAEIAARLHVSVRTVETHVASLLRKFAVTDRRALAEAAGGLPMGVPGALTGLPAALTQFIGRRREQELLLTALADCRLVTLHGPGGVGKSRLAAEVVRSARCTFPAGRVFVDLVPASGGYVDQAVAAALDIAGRPGESLTDAIAARFGESRFLLILDNCEHLADAVAALAERLLSLCPRLRIMTTSRERIGIRGERVVTLAPLPLGSDAELLFLDRIPAGDGRPAADAATVAEICARLDGMPLAIELAAARTPSLGINGVLAGLDDSLRFLAGGRGRTRRHRSVRAVIGWSHDLLSDEERRLFRRLAVFAGAFTLDAALAVTSMSRACLADLLGCLADKSLLVLQAGSPDRWRLLETVRAFAAEQLRAAGEEEPVRICHLAWFAAYGAELEGRLGGDWRNDFAAVADDLRSALAACPPGPDPAAHKLARVLGHLTFARRFLTEAIAHYEQAAVRAISPAEAAADLADAGNCALFAQPSGERAVELLLAAADQAARAGDADSEATALARVVEIVRRHTGGHPLALSRERLAGLLARAAAAADPGDPAVAAALAIATAWQVAPTEMTADPDLARAAEQAARATGDPVLISASLDATRAAACSAGRLREAHRISAERFGLLSSLDPYRPRSGNEIADIHNMLCTDAIAVGDLRGALAFADRRADDGLVSHSHLLMSARIPALVLLGRLAEATRAAARMWQTWQRAGCPAESVLPAGFGATALACCLLGEDRASRLWRARTDDLTKMVTGEPSRHLTFTSFVDARCAVHTGDLTSAADIVNAAFSDRVSGWYGAYARGAAAELAVVAGLPDAGRLLAAAAADAAENRWAAACLDRAAGRLRGDTAALKRAVAGWERIGARYERACTLLLLPEREAEGRAELADCAKA